MLEAQGYRCGVTGLELSLDAPGTKFHRNPWAPSLDRIDPHEGYTADNVRVVCWMYNAAKGTATDEEVRALCLAVINPEGIEP